MDFQPMLRLPSFAWQSLPAQVWLTPSRSLFVSAFQVLFPSVVNQVPPAASGTKPS